MTRDRKSEGGEFEGNTATDNYPSFLQNGSNVNIVPSLGETDICGAWGPQEPDGTILRCTLTDEDHTGLHRIQRGDRDRKWTYEHALKRDEQGELVGTYRPHGDQRPGPQPATHTQHEDVDYAELAHRADQDWQDKRRELGFDELWGAKSNPKADDGADDTLELADVHRPDQLHKLDTALCDDLEPELDRLPSDACLATWIHNDRVHACHRADEHQDMGTDRLAKLEPHHATAPHRCRCFCGTVTRSTTHGPLEATSRPEHPLTANTEDP